MKAALTLEQCWHRVPGGTAVAAIEVARALDRRGDVDVVGVAALHRGPPPAPWTPPIATRHLPLPRLALYESWHSLRWPPVERATGRVDVIHATGIAIPPASRPIVLTLHDLAFVDYPELFSRAGLRFFRHAVALALAEATVVLCSSLATLERCREVGFERDRLRHVPLGVDVRPAAVSDVERVRHAYSLDSPYVLWVGTIEPRKNLPRLLEAFALVDHDVGLALVGPRGWSEDLEPRLAAMPPKARARVRQLGWVPAVDLPALYAGAAAFCFPSLLEGFGFPVVEAMAQGTPVVTSLGTSTEELVTDGAGLAVDPRSSEAIAEALSRVLEDTMLAARLSNAGRARARTYTWERTAALVVDAYVAAAAHG